MKLTPDSVSEADFVDHYGDTVIKLGEKELTLNKALAMEALFCPADPEKRQDEDVRLKYLAGMVGQQMLLPEHQHLIDHTKTKQV